MTKVSPRHRMNHRDLQCLFRGSHRRCSVEKGDLKNFANFTVNHLCWSLFLDKKRLQHRCFPAKFGKVLGTPMLNNSFERLLLLVLSQNAIANSSGEFGLDETLTE